MTHVRVKPAREGESLSHPLDGPLATEGGRWRRDQFTFKRLRDGDVVEIPDADEAPASDPNLDATVQADRADQAVSQPQPELPAPAKPHAPAKPRILPISTTGPSAADTAKE